MGIFCRYLVVFVLLVLGSGILSSQASEPPTATVFESLPVRPLALSPDGKRLFAVNTPAGRLEVFDVTADGLTPAQGIAVGLEPIAVAVRDQSEVWVANHLSDSISIIDVSTGTPRITRTLAVCDEPSDIVFAGPENSRAFISMARRGQNCPIEHESHSPGVGRALVMAYDATNVGTGLGGTPLATITLFGDTPRALTRSSDGSTVYAAVFLSGNRTTSVHELTVCDGGSEAEPCEVDGKLLPGGLPAPNVNHAGIQGPEVGLIVRYDDASGQWVDEMGRDWSGAVRFNLPDKDVFAIDAMATPPVETAAFSGVGTVLYNMAVNPVNGDVYVANTEARNEIRFEGSGKFGTTVRGNFHQSKITVLHDGKVAPRHLNKHIDYAVSPVPAGVKAKSLALPMGMAVSPDGATLYVAAMGSGKVGILPTAKLADDSFVPDAAARIELPDSGPTGLILDGDGARLYVLTRFDNSVVAVDTSTRNIVSRMAMPNPEPAESIAGRSLLYDALRTSSNGEATCASCHVSGNFDGLAWDLGNPDGDVRPNPNPFRTIPGEAAPDVHPLKGPMLTQSLRGMANAGPMHFRGDRTGVYAEPPTDAMDEAGALRSFQPAFDGLLGRGAGPLSTAEIDSLGAMLLNISYPPNPIRPLDNQPKGGAARGKVLFGSNVQFGEIPRHAACLGCHVIDPASGFYGTDGVTTQGVLEPFKTPHMRNLYERVGMFGMTEAPLGPGVLLFQGTDTSHRGDQIRGFGFDHAGAVDSLRRFTHYVLFSFPDAADAEERVQQRQDVADYMLEFETEFAPIMGQQVTLRGDSLPEEHARVALMMARADVVYPNAHDAAARECELVVKGQVEGQSRGWLRLADGTYRSDRAADEPLSREALLALAAVAGQELTFTCVPPGSGVRAGVDADTDGVLDGDESATAPDAQDKTAAEGDYRERRFSTTKNRAVRTRIAAIAQPTLPE
jgi:DNA-binding beta-propeller fold protein YncE